MHAYIVAAELTTVHSWEEQASQALWVNSGTIAKQSTQWWVLLSQTDGMKHTPDHG
jgi:hypothetical protein